MMKSIMMRDSRVVLEDAPIPEPGSGQVLVKSLACGICGSDLHLVRHSREIFDFYREIGVVPADTNAQDLEINLGHEFCAEIVSFGPDTNQQLAIGSRVTAVPMLLGEQGQLGVGVTPGVPGAYSEYFLLEEALLLPVPDALPNEAAALVEPLAVGLHAVNHAQPEADEVALVAGCGPIGLACIAALKHLGVKTIVASDPLATGRNNAAAFGATHVADPGAQDEMALATELAGDRRLVVLECVGLPRMIPDFIQRTPEQACIVFTGLHTEPVPFNPAHATVKQLNLKFSYYYEPEEYAACLQVLTGGNIPWQRMITGTVGINHVPDAFATLMQRNEHVKVIIEPFSNHQLRAYR
ncbi:alcohol dehydrogenase [Seongchinamella unica]|uniref:Alcohol dehydrogenase n=2 Tax=Seongchinamella unica TaxID=2547392 RepID=A0A4R5LVH6_9GAMM|nr:alcohol dehydrogenase [Seongchinamella unica]